MVEGVHQDTIRGRRIGATSVDRSFRFHGALEAALDLDRFETRLKQASGRPLEQTLEEPLDSGKRARHPVRESSSRVLEVPVRTQRMQLSSCGVSTETGDLTAVLGAELEAVVFDGPGPTIRP